MFKKKKNKKTDNYWTGHPNLILKILRQSEHFDIRSLNTLGI